jgi:calreticulin
LKFHAISAPLETPFSNRGKDLVVQFTAKHETNEYSFCGGGYIKLLPSSVDLKGFNGKSDYHVMFGPDRCGYDVSKIHAIFNDGKKNLEKTDQIKLEYNDKDEYTHLYTLVVHPDNTYEVLFDEKSKAKGDLTEDWAFPSKMIPDPEDEKPADWVDEKEIPDPDDVKPEGYDDIPAQVPDPDAEMPDDWDEEDDGEWEPPMIDNPDFKGPWEPKMIPNPAYKGEWKAKRISNPKYRDDVYAFDDIAAVGFELWIVNNGTIFDNIIITDSLDEAKQHAKDHWHAIKDQEKEAKEAWEKAKNEAEEATDEGDDADDDDDSNDHDEL